MAKITIELTGRRPVVVESDEWTSIATAGETWHDGKVYAQANREADCDMSVWANADGRAIVFGDYNYDSAHQGARGIRARAGYVVPAVAAALNYDGVVEAIEQVGRDLKNAAGPEPRIDIDALVREAIDDLPAEALSTRPTSPTQCSCCSGLCTATATTTDDCGNAVCEDCVEYACDGDGQPHCSCSGDVVDEGEWTGGGMHGMGTGWVSRPVYRPKGGA